MSHVTVQQSGDSAQTASQHGVVKHPGFACTSSHRPPPPDGPHAGGGTSDAADGKAPTSDPYRANWQATAHAGDSIIEYPVAATASCDLLN